MLSQGVIQTLLFYPSLGTLGQLEQLENILQYVTGAKVVINEILI